MKKIIKHLKIEWHKYLFDTVVVIVGILIAFSLNNWNESRKQIIAENEFILGVKNDLKQDKIYISLVLKIYEDKEIIFHSINDELFNLYVNDKLKLVSLLNKYIASNRTFYPVVGTFESAMSGNEIGKFNNKSFCLGATKLYNSTYARLSDNAKNFDDRYFYLVKKYSYERRTGHLREMNHAQQIELLDDLFYYMKSMKYYINILNNAVKEIDELLDTN